MQDERDPHLTYLDFKGRVGDYLGYGWGLHNDDTEWDAGQERNIKEVVGSGQRWVYYPNPMGGVPAHSWSFLRPVRSFTVATGETGLLLPIGCGQQMESELVYSASSRRGWAPLQLTNWSYIRQQRLTYPDRSGPPIMAAVEPQDQSGSKASGPQRFRIEFFPQLDAEYTFQATFQVIPELLTAAQPWHWGGAQHSETFLAAVIAAAELFKDGERGPFWENFQMRLAASIDVDRRARPQILGYNGDSSDLRWSMSQGDAQLMQRRYIPGPIVTVGGLTPE